MKNEEYKVCLATMEWTFAALNGCLDRFIMVMEREVRVERS